MWWILFVIYLVVGINAPAPRILTEHTGDTFTEIAATATATMVYFIARMIG